MSFRETTMRMIVAAVLLSWATAGFAQSSSDERLVALRNALREAIETLKKTQDELANASSRLTDIEKSLAETEKPLSRETGEPASNTVQVIRLKPQNSWRHASGIIYIGVRGLDADDPFNCYVVASSDTVHSTSRTLYLAEALSIQSTQGKYRLVLRTVDKESCAFDLIKD